MSDSVFKIEFGQTGNSSSYLGKGWSWPEPKQNWTIGPTSELILPPLQFSQDALCTVVLAPHIKLPYRPLQRLSVAVNDLHIQAFEIDRFRSIQFIIPQSAISNTSENIIVFTHLDFISPYDTLGHQHARDLACLFLEISIAGIESLRLEGLDLSQWNYQWGQTAQQDIPGSYLGCGWMEQSLNGSLVLSLLGTQSDIHLPPMPMRATGRIILDVNPFILLPYRPLQRLKIALNGNELGRYNLTEPSSLNIEIPSGMLLETGENIIHITHPDFIVPHDVLGNADNRTLSGHINKIVIEVSLNAEDRRERTLPVRDLFLAFESLGNNCEFGLVQRQAGAEPLGLFRFSATGISSLVSALNADFAELGNLDKLKIEISGKEFVVRDLKYNLFYHTWIFEGQEDPDIIRQKESKKIKFLVRKFLDELEGGQKIFVYKNDPEISQPEALMLLRALRRHGNNPLLFVAVALGKNKPGQINNLGEGLFRGYVDRFHPNDNAYDVSFESWTTLCYNMYTMLKE